MTAHIHSVKITGINPVLQFSLHEGQSQPVRNSTALQKILSRSCGERSTSNADNSKRRIKWIFKNRSLTSPWQNSFQQVYLSFVKLRIRFQWQQVRQSVPVEAHGYGDGKSELRRAGYHPPSLSARLLCSRALSQHQCGEGGSLTAIHNAGHPV